LTAAKLFKNIQLALRFGRQNGWLALAKAVGTWLGTVLNPLAKINVTSQYDALLAPAFGTPITISDVSPISINWFIPLVGKGAGGHLNIFRFIRNLEALGYKNSIIIVGQPQPTSALLAKAQICQWFFDLKADVYLENDKNLPPAFFAMATSWPTAYYVKRFKSCIKKCYFVQDFEPCFFPDGSDSLLAEDTYRFGFFGFTVGGWLTEKLRIDYGMQTRSLGFSYDRDLYQKNSAVRKSDGFRRILFYARPPTARRAFELGLMVLRMVCQQQHDVRVVLAGWDVSGYQIPFPCEHAGLVELNELADLYNRCDAALVLSCSNLSLLPLELMACGVPVISNRAPYTQWLLNDENAMLAEPNIESLAQAVLQVINSPDLAGRLSSAGLAFTAQTSWEREAEILADGLAQLAASSS